MPTARKLKSGSWTCKILDHYEWIESPDGSKKKKGIYKSFTCKDPSRYGKRKCEQMASDYAAEKEVRRKIPDMTLGEAIDDYCNKREAVLQQRTIDEYRRIRKKHMSIIMDIPVSRITQDDIQTCINYEAMTHSAKTIRNWHGLISPVLKAYRTDLKLTTTLPSMERKEQDIPSEAEIKQLLSNLKGTNLEILVLLAIACPARRSEVCAIEKSDLDGSVLHISKAMVVTSERKWIIKVPKTKESDRYIELPKYIVTLFNSLPDGRITDLNPDQFYRAYQKALSDSGVRHYTLHSLRHYGASILHALGAPDQYVQKRGGWKSDYTMKRIYRHTIDEKEKQVNEIVNSYIESITN